MFTRPNGVAVDEEGNIIVADSRNDRVQIFTSSGRFISKFGMKGTGPGEFDRPSGMGLLGAENIVNAEAGFISCWAHHRPLGAEALVKAQEDFTSFWAQHGPPGAETLVKA